MFTAKFKKKNGKLVYINEQDKVKYNIFLDKIKEGSEVEVFMNPVLNNVSYAQMSKIHACIRQIAKETGHSFEEMKNIVKAESNIMTTEENDFRSFADCTKEEMAFIIDICIDLGRDLNINLE